MAAKNLHLPAPYYYTPAWLAADWGVHADRVLALIDCGAIAACPLVPKAPLAQELPGPATHVVVFVDSARLPWEGTGGERVAQVVGQFRAYLPDCNRNVDIDLSEADAVFVSRNDLVVLHAERERIETVQELQRIRPQERATLLHMLRAACRAAWPETDGPYALASLVADELARDGIELSQTTLTGKLKDAGFVSTRGHALC